jgi:hypothetical protein
VFGPAIFLLTGTGLSAFESARRHAFVDDPLSPLAALGALLLAGLLYGILVMVRLSPVGPGLAGMALFGLSAWGLAAPKAYDASFEAINVHMAGAVGQSGLGFLLGVPLLATLTSPRRWRRRQPLTYYAAPAAPAALDVTRQMATRPAYLTLPDIAPPSLHYPAAEPAVHQGPSSLRPPPQAPPKPAAATAPPKPAPAAPQIVNPAPARVQPAPVVSTGNDEDKTLKIDLAGDEPTAKLEP